MPNKKWTVMVWMAGDNNLQDAGEQDLQEMKKVGSTADVDVVVQFDRMSDQNTRRYHIQKGTPLQQDEVQSLGATNCGDPKVSTDFFVWAMKQYPADRYLASFWNHGGGIDETDVYARARSMGLPAGRKVRRGNGNGNGGAAVTEAHARVIANSRYRHALFSTTVEKAIVRRGIAYDDTARDFLDNAELKTVLKDVTTQTGKKIDLVGFDACLMNMIEIGYQLRQYAGYSVGSEQTEPGEGWPYDTVLGDLNANPAMGAGAFGTAIVKRYIGSYTSGGVTQSLLDLGRSDDIAKLVDALAKALLAAIKKPADYAAVTKATKAAQHYEYADFLDLCDLCAQLKTRVSAKAVKTAATAVMDALCGGASPFVVASKSKGKGVAKSFGASIYFPAARDVKVAYSSLDFAKATAWDEFIAAYQKP
ncbi:MAG: peptidase C11 [Acidobacteriia bacterium]|nr:peptidase C11 [Terriglobia bacterium]